MNLEVALYLSKSGQALGAAPGVSARALLTEEGIYVSFRNIGSRYFLSDLTELNKLDPVIHKIYQSINWSPEDKFSPLEALANQAKVEDGETG